MSYIISSNAYLNIVEDIAKDATSMKITGDTSVLPATDFFVYLATEASIPTPTIQDVELVHVTTFDSNTGIAEIERSQEGTTAHAFKAGDYIIHAVCNTNLHDQINQVLPVSPPVTANPVNVATATVDGLMSNIQKTKLDSLSTYTLNTATQGIIGGVKVGFGLDINADGVLDVTVSGGTQTIDMSGVIIPFTNITQKPNSISGYGITDAAISGHTHNEYVSTSDPDIIMLTNGKLPSDIFPTNAYQIIEVVDINNVTTPDNKALYVDTTAKKTFKYSGSALVEVSPTIVNSINGETGDVTVSYDMLTDKPTTLAEFGITDAALSTHNHDSIYIKSSDVNAQSGVAGSNGFGEIDPSLFKRASATYTSTSTNALGTLTLGSTNKPPEQTTVFVGAVKIGPGIDVDEYGSISVSPIEDNFIAPVLDIKPCYSGTPARKAGIASIHNFGTKYIARDVLGQLLVSDNYGKSWSYITDTLFGPVSSIAVNKNNVYISTANGLLQSTDLSSWVAISEAYKNVVHLEASDTEIYIIADNKFTVLANTGTITSTTALTKTPSCFKRINNIPLIGFTDGSIGSYNNTLSVVSVSNKPIKSIVYYNNYYAITDSTLYKSSNLTTWATSNDNVKPISQSVGSMYIYAVGSVVKAVVSLTDPVAVNKAFLGSTVSCISDDGRVCGSTIGDICTITDDPRKSISYMPERNELSTYGTKTLMPTGCVIANGYTLLAYKYNTRNGTYSVFTVWDGQSWAYSDPIPSSELYRPIIHNGYIYVSDGFSIYESCAPFKKWALSGLGVLDIIDGQLYRTYKNNIYMLNTCWELLGTIPDVNTGTYGTPYLLSSKLNGNFVAFAPNKSNLNLPGILLTSNDLKDWTQKSNPTNVTVFNNRVYWVGTTNVKVSTDGITWADSEITLTTATKLYVAGNKLFVAPNSAGNYYFTTDGTTWITKTIAEAIVSIIYNNGWYILGTSKIYKTTDLDTFEEIVRGNVQSLTNGYKPLGTSSTQVWELPDTTNALVHNLKDMSKPLGIYATYHKPSNRYFLNDVNGVFTCSEGFDDVKYIATTPTINRTCIHANGNTVYIGGNDNGVATLLQSTDNGTTWSSEQIHNDTDVINIRTIKDKVYIVTDNALYSVDGAITKVHDGETHKHICVFKNTVYSINANGNLRTSTDMAFWSTVNGTPTAVGLYVTATHIIIHTTSNDVFASTDGITWTKLYTDVSYFNTIGNMHWLTYTGSTTLMYTGDNGLSWRAAHNQGYSGMVKVLNISNSNDCLFEFTYGPYTYVLPVLSTYAPVIHNAVGKHAASISLAQSSRNILSNTSVMYRYDGLSITTYGTCISFDGKSFIQGLPLGLPYSFNTVNYKDTFYAGNASSYIYKSTDGFTWDVIPATAGDYAIVLNDKIYWYSPSTVTMFDPQTSVSSTVNASITIDDMATSTAICLVLTNNKATLSATTDFITFSARTIPSVIGTVLSLHSFNNVFVLHGTNATMYSTDTLTWDFIPDTTGDTSVIRLFTNTAGDTCAFIAHAGASPSTYPIITNLNTKNSVSVDWPAFGTIDYTDTMSTDSVVGDDIFIVLQNSAGTNTLHRITNVKAIADLLV